MGQMFSIVLKIQVKMPISQMEVLDFIPSSSFQIQLPVNEKPMRQPLLSSGSIMSA